MSKPNLRSESGLAWYIILGLIVAGLALLAGLLSWAFNAGQAAATPTVGFAFTASPPSTYSDGSMHCIDGSGDDFTVHLTASHPTIGTLNVEGETVTFSITEESNFTFSPNPPQPQTMPNGKATATISTAIDVTSLVTVTATVTLPNGNTYTAGPVGPYEAATRC